MKYKRILLKLSGEALMGELAFGIDPNILSRVADEITELQRLGVEIALVIGGGNLFRGAGLAKAGYDRVRGDQMGMLATVMNALAMQDALEKRHIVCNIFSALGIEQVGQKYSAIAAREALGQGHVVICAAGTGNPYFTTDTAASLRAIELEADLLLKATKVDGIYDADPKKYPDAKRYTQLTYAAVIRQELAVMDLTAMVMCRDNNMPLCVFDMFSAGALYSILQGEPVGTLVQGDQGHIKP